jgi:hypothetical protein
MSQPVASGNSRRTFALAVVLCIFLLPLAQAGVGYLALFASWPWFWLVGTPIGYLLIGGLGAFCAVGGLAAAQARSRGALLATLGGVGGALVAALIVAAIVIHALNVAQTQPDPASRSRGIPGLEIIVILFVFVPAFVVVNLFGVALAPLGGLLGGTLRANARQGGQPVPESPAGQEQSRAWIVAVVIGVTLAMLAGVATLVLITGAFPAVR